MAYTDGPKEEKLSMVGAKLNEKEVSVSPEKMHEIGESSAQGEARGHKVINNSIAIFACQSGTSRKSVSCHWHVIFVLAYCI
jgi:hypothetical protein